MQLSKSTGGNPDTDCVSSTNPGVLFLQGDEALESAFRTGIQAANQVLLEDEALQFHQLEPLIEMVPKGNIFMATQQGKVFGETMVFSVVILVIVLLPIITIQLAQ